MKSIIPRNRADHSQGMNGGGMKNHSRHENQCLGGANNGRLTFNGFANAQNANRLADDLMISPNYAFFLLAACRPIDAAYIHPILCYVASSPRLPLIDVL